ncbi:hypothetical protein [Streptomyces sp. NBRC 110028]|uniref:hypothetical protein n=1 Tax=Streptomyces sp. NBRC 110028 TaxID=1621260 RepID=UPI000AF40804|nr:hypothetical protein [Streptomyces sp. NBRC 110028]
MLDLIRRALEWVRSVCVALRPRGRHRAGPTALTGPAATVALPLPITNGVPSSAFAARRPTAPDPRDLDATFDTGRLLVRPYVLAHEERERSRCERRHQRKRRRVLLLALDGVDAGPEWIHGVLVGAGR